jgi:PDZ domain-containing protein
MESTTGSTGAGSVPVDPKGPIEHHPDRTRRVALLVAAFVFVSGFFWWAGSADLPYYAIAPGSAVDTSGLVQVSGDHGHEPDGKILLTTVSLGKVTLLQALEGWLDPAIDVVKEEIIAGPDVNEEQLRQQNLDAMEQSKKSAIGVAFEELGVDAITSKGVEVLEVVAGSPADKAGIVAGEMIVGVDGRPTDLDIKAVRALGAHEPGDEVTLEIAPADGGPTHDVEATLAEHPDIPGRAFLGVSLQTKDLQFDFPFDVTVQSERIGGPSAGLAFTLEVLDYLTPGELTGGAKVATTGTIELDGSVGEVGGVAQKTIAVRRSGATLFLVPSAELATAKRFAGDDLEVLPVDTLDDALAALATVGGNGLALPKLDADGAS